MRVIYRVPAPVPSQDGEPTWVKANVYRAPDSGGAPGSWTLIANMPLTLSLTDGFTPIEDTSASSTSNWYRHEYLDETELLSNGYSTAVQVNTFQALAWILADIPDADVVDMWSRWSAEAVAGLWAAGGVGVWTPDKATITPVITDSSVDPLPDEYYDIPVEIEEINRVEAVWASTGRHMDWLYPEEWEQEGRQLRIYDADLFRLYVIHGRRRYRSVSELPETLYLLYYWLARKAYLMFRQSQRANFLEWVTFGSRRSSISPEQIDLFARRADVEIALQIAIVAPAVEGVGVPVGQPD